MTKRLWVLERETKLYYSGDAIPDVITRPLAINNSVKGIYEALEFHNGDDTEGDGVLRKVNSYYVMPFYLNQHNHLFTRTRISIAENCGDNVERTTSEDVKNDLLSYDEINPEMPLILRGGRNY